MLSLRKFSAHSWLARKIQTLPFDILEANFTLVELTILATAHLHSLLVLVSWALLGKAFVSTTVA